MKLNLLLKYVLYNSCTYNTFWTHYNSPYVNTLFIQHESGAHVSVPILLCCNPQVAFNNEYCYSITIDIMCVGKIISSNYMIRFYTMFVNYTEKEYPEERTEKKCLLPYAYYNHLTY